MTENKYLYNLLKGVLKLDDKCVDFNLDVPLDGPVTITETRIYISDNLDINTKSDKREFTR